MRIFLTGASGFIGSHILAELVRQQHQVTILTRPSSNLWRIKPYLNRITQIDQNQLREYFSTARLDLILHFATHYVKSHRSEDVAKMIEGNISLACQILELGCKYQVKYFINIGTCFEYQLTRSAVSESELLHPYNLYAATKIAFEDIFKFYVQQNQLKAVTLKLFYPYGELDNQKVIPIMIKSLLNNQHLTISKGEQQLDFTYVGDIVAAALKAIDYVLAISSPNYDVFNIGEGKAKSLAQIAELLNKLHGKKLISCTQDYPKNDIMHMVADIAKAKKLLNWQPVTDIETGIKKNYQFYKQKYGQINH